MSLQVVELREPQTGASARVLVSLGFNCFEYRAPVDGQLRDILWSLPGYEDGTRRPSSSGIPILFPFPGRIRGTTFVWEGKNYELEVGDKLGNAIHGLVYTRPWRVIDQSESRVVGQFQASLDDPRLVNCWPCDFRITVAYELTPGLLRCEVQIVNPDGRQSLPCGLGLHPYFRVPPGGGDGADWRIQLPVRKRWELIDLIPTGQQLPLEQADALQTGVRYGDMQYDDVFTDLTLSGSWRQAAIVSPRGKPVTVLRFDTGFRECVVFTPPHREAICIEPLTCVPDCFRLQPQGIDAGLRVLAPGDSFGTTVEIHVAP